MGSDSFSQDCIGDLFGYGMDVADPRAPLIVGVSPQSFDGWGIALAGNYVYLTSPEGLRVFKIADPSHPIQVGALPLSLSTSDLSIVGNRAYLVGGKFYVVDINHPDAPTLIGTFDFSDD